MGRLQTSFQPVQDTEWIKKQWVLLSHSKSRRHQVYFLLSDKAKMMWCLLPTMLSALNYRAITYFRTFRVIFISRWRQKDVIQWALGMNENSLPLICQTVNLWIKNAYPLLSLRSLSLSTRSFYCLLFKYLRAIQSSKFLRVPCFTHIWQLIYHVLSFYRCHLNWLLQAISIFCTSWFLRICLGAVWLNFTLICSWFTMFWYFTDFIGFDRSFCHAITLWASFSWAVNLFYLTR